MPIQIHLPTALRPYAGGQETVEVPAKTVGEAVAALTARHAQLKTHLLKEDGSLRNFVNLYLNDEDVRHLKGPATPLKEGDELLLVPSIAGGSSSAGPKGAARQAACAALELPPLTPEELQRYGRHLVLPEVGMEGQRKLKAARVLTVGAGGLGSPLSMYLAAAGVGTIGVVDFDTVEASNLQRQILYSTSDAGRPKLAAAKERLKALNPSVEIAAHELRLDSKNALALFKGYDVVADGTDNFPTRYLVNDACALLGKPNVYGSVFRFEGQVSVFWAERGPCYRCLYPEPPPPGLVPDCATGGVLGVLPGIIGALQAAEVLKLILGAGKPLIGTLVLFDALKMEWRRLKLRKDPGCPLCGTNPTITQLVDYEAFCGLKPNTQGGAATPSDIPEVSVEDLKAKLDGKEDFLLLDVRETFERDIARIPGSKLVPLGEVEARLGELAAFKDKEILVHCKMGARSAKAVKLLRGRGFARAFNVAGGINAWSERIDKSVPKY